MEYLIGLPDKVIEKYHTEIFELHQRCCKTYLIQKGLKHRNIQKFFRLYEKYITEDNVLDYWNIPISLFVQALVKDTLNQYFKYQKHVH